MAEALRMSPREQGGRRVGEELGRGRMVRDRSEGITLEEFDASQAAGGGRLAWSRVHFGAR